MGDITVFSAKKIITMDPNRPEATHVAVREGRILAVGERDCADQWGAVVHDDRLADAVLMPGFVEGHCHMGASTPWDYAYVGAHDRVDPDGRLWPGTTDIETVIANARAHADSLPDDAPIITWGFDPIFLSSERLNRHHLDRISAERPVVFLFSSGHLMCINSVMLDLVGYDAESSVEGVMMGEDGKPNGELQEMAAMFPVMRRLGLDHRAKAYEEPYIKKFALHCVRAGVTTATDLFAMLTEASAAELSRVTARPDFPVRIVPALSSLAGKPEDVVAQVRALESTGHDKLRFGAVKLMTDGSIQGWSARVKWPGYVGGQANGIWNTPPEQIYAICEVMQREGVQMHIHTNGDEASEVTLDALEAAARKHPWPGARHVLQHAQMMGRGLFERAAELGVCVNLFANHIWYFGDQHVAQTIGAVRAARMNACRSALDTGVRLAIHSDAPVTPLGPLFTAWCAANRLTMSGKVLGAAQCISVQEALRLITLGAAYTLGLDGEVGSIEAGKRADFAVLGDDPLGIAAEKLKDVPVRGTVTGGYVTLLDQ
ncbi:amidohydrolase [Aquicoccus sp. G2-2]|uniref:amidohydrolase n=1 Tax=Aquicoccus sp. G2-2 TaxID=3092120 RepID=UPI002ADF71FF|nr:amidohydrolase [Aquicoccus sp. G2-2]MEA1114280.1 amidohydrolase [Aquicoccus sp. G2-2]